MRTQLTIGRITKSNTYVHPNIVQTQSDLSDVCVSCRT